jgi:hypothetical protein
MPTTRHLLDFSNGRNSYSFTGSYFARAWVMFPSYEGATPVSSQGSESTYVAARLDVLIATAYIAKK